jgi:hypothetical protein
MLAEAIQRECDREDKEDRDHVRAQRGGKSPEDGDQREDRQVREDRHAALEGDLLLQWVWIRGAFSACRAEVNRKERRGRIQQLVPSRVGLRREMVPLRVVFR